MNQTSKLQALQQELTPKQVAEREAIADWLNTYPWTFFWTPTFRRKELAGSPSYSRSGGFDLNTGQRTGGGSFVANPFWKKPGDADYELHVSGYSEDAAIRTTKRFLKRHMKDYSYFFIAEDNPGRDGHHVHCLLIPPTGKGVEVSKLGSMWWNDYGWNKFERIRSPEKVTQYCLKHVTKYVTKGKGWYEIEINDSAIFHAATQAGDVDNTDRSQSAAPSTSADHRIFPKGNSRRKG